MPCPTYLSDLTEVDRRHIEQCIKRVQRSLQSCEDRLSSYEIVEPCCGTVFKLINDLKQTSIIVDEMTNQLVMKHRLPEELTPIDEELRQAFSNVLIGIGCDSD